MTWPPWSQWEDPLLIWVSLCVYFPLALKWDSKCTCLVSMIIYKKENKREMNGIDSRSLHSTRNIKIRLSGSKMPYQALQSHRANWNFKIVACHHRSKCFRKLWEWCFSSRQWIRSLVRDGLLRKYVNRVTEAFKITSVVYFVHLKPADNTIHLVCVDQITACLKQLEGYT